MRVNGILSLFPFCDVCSAEAPGNNYRVCEGFSRSLVLRSIVLG